jgi:hypothetical protein
LPRCFQPPRSAVAQLFKFTHVHAFIHSFIHSFGRVQPGGVQERMKPWGYASMVVYTMGLPVLFTWLLYQHREGIRADQQLRAQNRGLSRESNPHFHLRMRYQELYRFESLLLFEYLSLCHTWAPLQSDSGTLNECSAGHVQLEVVVLGSLLVTLQLVPSRGILLATAADAAQVLHCVGRAPVQLLAAVPSVVSERRLIRLCHHSMLFFSLHYGFQCSESLFVASVH